MGRPGRGCQFANAGPAKCRCGDGVYLGKEATKRKALVACECEELARGGSHPDLSACAAKKNAEGLRCDLTEYE